MELGISTTKKNRISIYADGEFLFTVPAVIWYSSHLREGDEVTEKDLEELKREADLECAFDSAIRMLSLRAHSEYELKIKLKQRFSEDAVGFAIDKLRGLKLLDDASFALDYADELYRRKGFAPKRIIIELKNRGIDGSTAEKAVNSLDIDREIGIIKVIEKYHLTKDSTPKERDRVIRRLLNMGYSFSDISKHINIYE